ncbi:MAG: SAM-dependent methyltransferase, partial [Alicyclobacillus sp.]|nr:SAM-dependent methyltransferase [Alicyclobacillus sp.]
MAEVPFSDFMEAALYGEDGYYRRRVSIGREGDFYTAARFPLFAFGVARYIAAAWARLGRPGTLQVVELGAGQGELAGYLCTRLAELLPGVDVEYVILERSPFLRSVQRRRFEDAGKLPDTVRIRWGGPDPDRLSVVLANEVLDAQPDVLNHNVETVPRLFPTVRPEGDYGRSLELLAWAGSHLARGHTKSGLMVGLG